MERVLKIRKAPTKSATAAINAVVERKSAVELRRELATSAGDDRTYGPLVRATPMAVATSAGVAPSPAMTSTRLTRVVAEDPLHRPEGQHDRPARRADERAVTDGDPDHPELDRRPVAGLEGHGTTDGRADRRRQRLADERLERVGSAEGGARFEDESRTADSFAGSMPRAVTGSDGDGSVRDGKR